VIGLRVSTSPEPGGVNAEGRKTHVNNVSDAHSFTVVSAELVEMALLSGLQLNAYYERGARLNFSRS